LALAVRLYGLGDKPFWLDEVASLHRATVSLPKLTVNSLHANHYPSYFAVLWLIAKLGTSQWLLRLPSALFGALAACTAYAIGRAASAARSGTVAGLLMALSPFQVQFGQEARPYTLVTWLILVALWGLIRLARDPQAASMTLLAKGAPQGAWLAYGIGTAAALDVLNVAVPWFVAANIAALVIGRAAGDMKRGFWRNWICVQLGIVTAWAPMLIAVYVARKGAIIDDVGWAWPATRETIRSIVGPVYLLRISNFIVPGMAPAAVPALSLAIAALAAIGAWHLRRRPAVFAVLGAATLILPISLGLVSLFVPVLVPRYFAWSAGPFFVLAGVGLEQLFRERLSRVRSVALGVALTVVCLINLAPYYDYETKPRWDLAARELAALARPGDVVLVNSYYAYWVLSNFARPAGLDEDRIKVTWKREEAIPPPGHTLWAIYGRTGPAFDETAEGFHASLAMLGASPAAAPIGRSICLWRYPGAALSASAQPPNPRGSS
jgi:4-amino-4-deoxy-L-arabinose transferase-like glycosyltransferase